jgi:hypothetical protein
MAAGLHAASTNRLGPVLWRSGKKLKNEEQQMHSQPFGAQLLTLPMIFEGHLFTIPDYQRGYAWDERQVEEMLNDVDHLINDGVAHRHYTGTLVLGRPPGTFAGEHHVVDGQQRLTTLVIILRQLADHLPPEDLSAFEELYLRRGPVGADRSVLRLNSDTRQFFERVIMVDGNLNDEPISLEAHERLLKARKLVQSWMQRHIVAGTPVYQLRATIEHELGFLVYAPSEDSETGIMFEVINNRGKPLSELEKVKNYLIYSCVKLNATSLRADIDRDWSVIIRDLSAAKKTSPADEGAFLRYCMVVHFSLNKTDSQYGYDELKRRLALDKSLKDPKGKIVVIEEIASFVRFMKQAALWYARLYGQRHEHLDTSLISLLEQFRGQDRHASIMPIFLSLVIRNEGQGQPLLRLLGLLERVNFRVYMARNITARNDTGQGDLYAYAAAYYHSTLLVDIPQNEREQKALRIETDDQALEYRLVQFALWHAPDSLFESSLILEKDSNDDFFKWGGLRYFLMNYEQELQPFKTIKIDKITMARSEGKSADYLSVEHRWAAENRNEEGENDRVSDKFEKRRLGNFVLLELRLNIQASKAGLEEKLANYMGKGEEPPTDLEQVRKMVRDSRKVLVDMYAWNRSKNYYRQLHCTVNDLAEERLRKFALKRWSLREYFGFRELKRQSESEWAEDEE